MSKKILVVHNKTFPKKFVSKLNKKYGLRSVYLLRSMSYENWTKLKNNKPEFASTYEMVFVDSMYAIGNEMSYTSYDDFVEKLLSNIPELTLYNVDSDSMLLTKTSNDLNQFKPIQLYIPNDVSYELTEFNWTFDRDECLQRVNQILDGKINKTRKILLDAQTELNKLLALKETNS